MLTYNLEGAHHHQDKLTRDCDVLVVDDLRRQLIDRSTMSTA